MAPDHGLPECDAEHSAAPGSIWTVPAVDGMVAIMSRPHMRENTCYYFALPLYATTSAVSAHSSLDILIDEQDSTLRVPLIGAFWNTRPLESAQLGEETGRVTTEALLVDLYLMRGGIDEKTRKHWRLGKDAMLTPKIRSARDDEVKRWLAL